MCVALSHQVLGKFVMQRGDQNCIVITALSSPGFSVWVSFVPVWVCPAFSLPWLRTQLRLWQGSETGWCFIEMMTEQKVHSGRFQPDHCNPNSVCMCVQISISFP